jgi:hypothetical protein
MQVCWWFSLVVAFGSYAFFFTGKTQLNDQLLPIVAFGSNTFTLATRPYITAYEQALQIDAVAFGSSTTCISQPNN